METRELVLKHLAPGLGCVVAFIMFISPLQAVLRVRRSKQLGDLNPLPLVAIIGNCTAWLLYGCINRDPYVIAANEPGLLLGFFMTVTCYAFADAKRRDYMVLALLSFVTIISTTSVTLSLAVTEQAQRSKIAGYLAVFVLLCYYSSPLSTLSAVLATRNSASLHWPLSVMSCVNGSLWVAYALAVGDAFILYPNIVGASFGVLQVVCILIFPAKPVAVHTHTLCDDEEQSSLHQPLALEQ